MNFYVIGVIVTLVILGLFVIYANETEHGYDQGYEDAVEDYRRQMHAAMWQQYFDQAQGGHDEEDKDE
jgi:hypothetical protein